MWILKLISDGITVLALVGVAEIVFPPFSVCIGVLMITADSVTLSVFTGVRVISIVFVAIPVRDFVTVLVIVLDLEGVVVVSAEGEADEDGVLVGDRVIVTVLVIERDAVLVQVDEIDGVLVGDGVTVTVPVIEADAVLVGVDDFDGVEDIDDVGVSDADEDVVGVGDGPNALIVHFKMGKPPTSPALQIVSSSQHSSSETQYTFPSISPRSEDIPCPAVP